jgi:hypothetical protein
MCTSDDFVDTHISFICSINAPDAAKLRRTYKKTHEEPLFTKTAHVNVLNIARARQNHVARLAHERVYEYDQENAARKLIPQKPWVF